MKLKNLFFTAITLCVGFAALSCGSDDDGDGVDTGNTNTVTLGDAKNAGGAVQFTLTTPLAVATGSTEAELTNVYITDGGKATFEVTDKKDGKKYYKTYDVTVKDGTYSISGIGALSKTTLSAKTRAESKEHLTINVILNIAGLGQLTFRTDDPVGVIEKTNTLSGGTVLKYLARTWKVQSVTIDLDGDVKVFKTITGNNLASVRDEAIRQGVSFTEEEKAEFNRVIDNIDISTTGIFTINYTNGNSDAADWRWIGNLYDQFKINLKELGMGNKYLADDATVKVEFKDKRCNLAFAVKITGNQKYDATFTLNLIAQ